MKKTPIVSIVITTRNEEKHIEDCLISLKKQNYPSQKLEIIIVDNNSTDNTKKLAKKYTQKVYNKGPERAAQRNFGLRKSRGTYGLYIDADMILSKNVIRDCAASVEKNQEIDGLYIPEMVTGNSFWSSVRRFERGFYTGTVIDCVRFVRMSTFKKIRGFDETMTGPEDWDFDKKIRQLGKVGIIKAPLYHNESNFSVNRYVNKKLYYAKSLRRYIKKWGKEDKDIKKQLGFYYRYIGVFIENDKWKKLIRYPHLALGMFFLRLLVGLAYLKSR